MYSNNNVAIDITGLPIFPKKRSCCYRLFTILATGRMTTNGSFISPISQRHPDAFLAAKIIFSGNNYPENT
jgi:hypothetical protein